MMSLLMQHVSVSFTRAPWLAWGAVFQFLLAAVLLILMLYNHYSGPTIEVMGLNRWVKPLKFALSIGVYMLSMAVVLPYWTRGQASWLHIIICLCMVVEISCIVLQAARGVSSHFNITTPFNISIYATMGTMIYINTMALCYCWWLSLYPADGTTSPYPALSPALHSAIVWGLALVVLASLQGIHMVAVVHSSRVGGPMGGAGLPFLNWSTQFGDLRVAHFIGLHGLQLVPLAVVIAARLGYHSIWIARSGGLLILALMVLAFLQAMAGRAVVSD